MVKEYVERRDGSLYLIGSRVPLARIVWEFNNGEQAEAIQMHFPTLSLEQVYGAIAFYLGNKEEADRDFSERQREEEEFARTHPMPPHLKEKLDRARIELLARKS